MSDLGRLPSFHESSVDAEGVVQKQVASQKESTLSSLISKVSKFAMPMFSKIAAQLEKGAKSVLDNKVIRKLKDVLDFLDKCEFKFIRSKKDPYLKEQLDDVLQQILTRYHIFEQRHHKMPPEDVLEEIIQLLLAIGAVKFSPERYIVRNAIVAELLTKHLVANLIQDNILIPIPCFDRKGQPVIINYQLHIKLNLGATAIPVYLFVPAAEEDKNQFSPLLIFRGTKFSFSKGEDIRSIIENLNRAGPARGIYEDFKKDLKELFLSWPLEDSKPLFRIMGYSQGAVLGQRAIVDFYPFIEKGNLNASILFNSPGVEADYVEAWDKISLNERPVCINILVTRDVVSKRGLKFIGDVYEIEPLEKGTFLHAHLGSKFIAATIEVYEVDNEKEALSESRKLVNEVMSSSLVDSLYKMASYGMADPAPKGLRVRSKKM